jgi:hypothetical protein
MSTPPSPQSLSHAIRFLSIDAIVRAERRQSQPQRAALSQASMVMVAARPMRKSSFMDSSSWAMVAVRLSRFEIQLTNDRA